MGKQDKNMFYSQCFLSKKGIFGTVWVAAHCLKRLKNERVKETNISSSVNKILQDAVPVLTYRILGYLLLGIVRIYSKKIEYLFLDCRDLLTKISDILGKEADAHIKSQCAPSLSIILPKSFELDAFNLEVVEDVSRGNQRPQEDIMLEGALKSKDRGFHSVDGYHHEEDAASLEANTGMCTPVQDVLSPHRVVNHLVPSPCNLSNLEASMEKFHATRFSLEECLDPLIIDLAEEESYLSGLVAEPIQTDGGQTKYIDTEMGFREQEELPDLFQSCDEQHGLDVDQVIFPEKMSPESKKCIASKEWSVSITIDVTPLSKFPSTSGASIPEFMAVRTPATKERAKIFKKRKCQFDENPMLPSKELKEWIGNPSDLVCKRKKAPHTEYHAWKQQQISGLPQSFLKPLISCTSIDLRSYISERKSKTPIPVELVQIRDEGDQLGSSSYFRCSDECALAPLTPVVHSAPSRLQEVHGVRKLDEVGPASSFDSIDKEPSLEKVLDFDSSVVNKDVYFCGGGQQEKHEWSIRTRKVATYLQKKLREDKIINLSQILTGKTRKESARLFYEILVLKTGEYIDVTQGSAYKEILMSGTPKLGQSCKADGGRDS